MVRMYVVISRVCHSTAPCIPGSMQAAEPSPSDKLTPQASEAPASSECVKKDCSGLQAVAAKLKKKTDITADKIIEDEPLESGAARDEDDDEIEAKLPAEHVWEREALVSTKSEPTQALQFHCVPLWLPEPLQRCRLGLCLMHVLCEAHPHEVKRLLEAWCARSAGGLTRG